MISMSIKNSQINGKNQSKPNNNPYETTQNDTSYNRRLLEAGNSNQEFK